MTVYNLRYLLSSFKFIAFGQFAMSNGISKFTVASQKNRTEVLVKAAYEYNSYIRVIYQLDPIFVYFSSTCFGLTCTSSGAIEL